MDALVIMFFILNQINRSMQTVTSMEGGPFSKVFKRLKCLNLFLMANLKNGGKCLPS